MFNQMFRLIFLASILLSGCSMFVIGDNVAIVTGETPEDCVVTLKPESDDSEKHFYNRNVNGIFSESFTISPSPDIYTLKISCSGKTVIFKQVKLPKESAKLNIGKVVN